jgi:MYXO-CTERM domain-containing protein
LGAALADQLVWSSANLLTYGANLGDFGTALLATADDMVAQAQMQAAQRDQVADAIEARGLHECGREIPLRVDEPRTTNLFGLDLIGQFLGGDCAAAKTFGVQLHSYFHFVFTPTADDQGVRLSVQMTPTDGGELSWGIYVKKDSHVTFMDSGFIPVVDQYDHAVESITVQDGELVIDASSDPPFDPNATYHAVVVHQNCPFAAAVLSAESMQPMPPGSGGGGGAGGAGGSGVVDPITVDDGCGCEVVGSQRADWPAGLWALVLAGLGALRRRRA